jgi:sugar/nucleoside kinase (ribokinase family)
MRYDALFLGNYTRDTIVNPEGVSTVNGGAFYYGANVACRLGLRTAAVTRLAREDFAVVEELSGLGVSVRAQTTPRSTVLRLEYPDADPDHRRILVESTAGSFQPRQVEGLRARVACIGASFRGEVGLEVLERLRQQGADIALDVQGFVRVVREGCLEHDAWAERREILSLVRWLKADAAEAAQLTGNENLREAARALQDLGPQEIVLTHRDGMLVFDGREYFETGFHPQRLVGRSGRGDTCIAAYVCRRLEAEPAQAAVWAAAITSLKMESDGPFRRDRAAVENLIREWYA